MTPDGERGELSGVVAATRTLRDQLEADVPLARDREAHIRATARACAANDLLELALTTATILSEPSEPTNPGI